MFLATTILGGKPLKMLDLHYKMEETFNHVAKFGGIRLTHAEIPWRTKKIIKTSAVKHKSTLKTIVSGQTKKDRIAIF